MVNLRSPNLSPVSIEDCFDTTSMQSVREFSDTLIYEINKQKDAGMSCNVMYVILQFFAANLMQDIQHDAKVRMIEKELAEGKTP